MTGQRNLKKFKDIYDNTYDEILKYCICKCSNIEEVNDIIQETYLELYKKLDNDIDDINAYIKGIAQNKIRKHYGILYRLRGKSLNDEDIYENELINSIPSDIDIENITISKDDMDFIWNYLNKKGITIQRIFYLYYVCGYKLKEIAEILSKSEVYIKSNLYRTLKELKNIMKEGENNE